MTREDTVSRRKACGVRHVIQLMTRACLMYDPVLNLEYLLKANKFDDIDIRVI